MKLGIIGAMEQEVETLLGLLENKTSQVRAGSTFHEGRLEGLEVVVVQCGIGTVNAALCVQILCDCYSVTHVVNTGVAGSLSADLDIGDLVISKEAVYHDFDCSVINDAYRVGQVPGLPVWSFPADPALMELAMKAAEAVNPGHNRIGTVASGDQFICNKEVKAQIVANTGAICTEMEGAAISHAAWRNQVPFVVLRAISDKADDSAEMEYPVFEAIAAARCAAVTENLASQLLNA